MTELAFGEGVDPENLTATYTDGVLHVTIPASPRSQPRRVEITHATGAAVGQPSTPRSSMCDLRCRFMYGYVVG